MMQSDRSTEFNRCMSEAMFGYAKASMAAYTAFLDQSMSFWTGNSPSPVPAWPKAPTTPFAPAMSMNPFTFWGDVFATWGSARPTVAPPLAYMMIAWGMPRDVAWPAAEANAAMLDAADTATASFNETFARYRSDGGHASAHVVSPKKMALTMMYGPIGAAMLSSWPGANGPL